MLIKTIIHVNVRGTVNDGKNVHSHPQMHRKNS